MKWKQYAFFALFGVLAAVASAIDNEPWWVFVFALSGGSNLAIAVYEYAEELTRARGSARHG